ncbi:hypothetical protein TrCOL_g2077 [Triparma columacea]|jgi:kinetochore protein Spc24, animal type|uniref:Kinetochore protein Spc24 n=1 Tax=Triparma columacea TaxID=722753 RepID=A0A9W7G5K7_9STRA|nr:hypothetical protein TrCOL_g2077 [Triparma columacea]
MVAQNQAISWEATVDIMKELTDLYRGNDTDDAADAALISKVVDQVQKTSDEKRTSLSEQVDVLSQKVAEAEARCERENNAEYDSRMSELTRRETVLSEEVEVLEQTTSEIEKRVAMYNNEAKSESELMELTESSKSEEVPRMRHAISLYANITGIKFDYTKEGRLAGAIAIPQSEEVHPFSINASKCSSFEIAEQLWGMMEVE